MEKIALVKTHDFLSGTSEMDWRISTFDWNNTPLGDPSQWSHSLRSALSLMLANRFPMILWWGKEYVQFYNDAYIPITGLKHPDKVFGLPGYEGWAEIWDVIGPLVDTPYNGGPATWMEDILLKLNRNNFIEETHFIIAYSPVPDPSVPSGIGGVLAIVNEITESSIGKRQMETLKELGENISLALSEDQVYKKAAEALKENSYDFPFALIYKVENNGTVAVPAAYSGIDANNPGLPSSIDLVNTPAESKNFALAVTENKIVEATDNGSWKDLPRGNWDIAPHRIVHIPIRTTNKNLPSAILTIGLNPYRRFDDTYRNFVQLVADRITLSVNNVNAYEEERKRAEALAELDKAKTIFFSNISHEFRTPLTLMLGTIEEVMKDPVTHPNNLQRMTAAHRNSMRLLKLVNALLDFSRIESGRQKANYTPSDIALLTKNLAGNFRSVIEKAGLTFTVKTDNIAEAVYIDTAMWEKIVFNLLSNAFKYTLEGSIIVNLFSEKDHVILEVVDTGVGIPENELPHMFERFHRVQNVAGRTHEGTGIGLSFVRELVQLHGGSISVTSKEEKGSSFRVVIPFGREHLPAEQISDQSKELEDVLTDIYIDEANSLLGIESVDSISEGNSQWATILVVDDNADMRQHLQSLLRKQFNVVTASNGIEALDKMKARRPSLILSDIMMPVMDGIQLLTEVRNNPDTATIPVILLTARAGEESKIEGYDTGADDYLVKPFSANELLARIKAQISISGKRGEVEARLKGFLMQAPAAIALFEGPRHVFTMANPLFQQVFGRNSEQLMGRPLTEVYTEIENQGIIELFDNVYNNGKPHSQLSFPAVLNINGETRQGYYDFILQPIKDSENNTTGIMVHAVDVTAQVKAREKMENLSAELEQKVKERTAELEAKNTELHRLISELTDLEIKNEKKDDFILMASHELKTPLTTISGYVQLLTEIRATTGTSSAIDTPLFDSALKTVQKQVTNLTTLVSELLDLSRIDKGQFEFHKTEFDLAELVSDAVNDLQYTTQHKIQLKVDSKHKVFADRDRIMQVVLNFTTNAIKYSPGANKIEINVFTSEDNHAAVSVKDYGIGIDKADHEKIFERFYRAEGKKEKTFPGFGIGLFIASDIVRRHNGTISVKSEKNKGSEFTFTLPTTDKQ